jgi:Protein of unknown function (DUF3551)
MRLLVLTILALAASAAAGPVAAQPYDPRYPVCLRVYGPATYNECAYTTLAQCQATASGRAAECYPNAFYANAAMAPSDRRHRHYGAY